MLSLLERAGHRLSDVVDRDDFHSLNRVKLPPTGRDEAAGKPHALRFVESLGDVRHRPDFARQSDFPDRKVLAA